MAVTFFFQPRCFHPLSLSIRMRSCASPSRPSAARSSRCRCHIRWMSIAAAPFNPLRSTKAMMTAEAATTAPRSRTPLRTIGGDDNATSPTTTNHVGTTHHPAEQNRHTAHIRFVISISSRTSSATGAPTRRITSGNSQITSSNISASSSSPRSLWKGLLALPRSARPPTASCDQLASPPSQPPSVRTRRSMWSRWLFHLTQHLGDCGRRCLPQHEHDCQSQGSQEEHEHARGKCH